MKNILLLALVALIGLVSCKPKEATNEETTTQATDTTMTAPPGYENVSAELVGMYKGILPCADCDGIETVLVLNADNTYLLKTTYLGKSDAAASENTGTLRWNPEQSYIILGGLVNASNKFTVGENKLTQLDIDGNPMTGAMADKYILTKQ